MVSISERHPAYSPVFPHGEHGWHTDLFLDEPEKEVGGKLPGRLTQMRYYAFRLFLRNRKFSTILHGGRLLQQYMVNAFAACD
jgi:hypothetical protein